MSSCFFLFHARRYLYQAKGLRGRWLKQVIWLNGDQAYALAKDLIPALFEEPAIRPECACLDWRFCYVPLMECWEAEFSGVLLDGARENE